VSKPLDRLPGSYGWPLIGNTIAAVRDPWRFDREMTQRYGALHRSRVLGVDWVNLTSPSLASVVLLDRERCLSSERGWAPVLGELFPGGLMLRDFEDHQRHRRLMQVAFREPARRNYQLLVDRETARSIDGWGAVALRLYPALKQALIEQAATVFLGLELGSSSAGLSAPEFVRAFTAMMDASIAPLHRDWPGTSWRRGLRARAWLKQLLAARAPARRGHGGSDLFTLLCNVEGEQGERFAEREAIDHVLFVLLAAHDTSATALATLFDALVADPELQEQLRSECRALGSPNLSFEQIDSLVACDRAHREALRLNPPAPYILRSNVRPITLDGHEIPSGAALNVAVRMVHVDPTVWTEPERFDPERFCPARAEHHRHPHGYIPFGGGSHRCIGADFARQQALTFVFHLLTRYRIRGTPCRWQKLPIPRPRDGQPVVLERLPS
jgi:cytochrome P450